MTPTNGNCDAFRQQLPDYLEEALDDSALADAELHLASCAECRALVADLRDITRQAAALPGLAPSRDLWPEIEARTQPRVLAFAGKPAGAGSWSRWRLGAVAAGLVAVTAVTTWQLARRPGGPSPATTVAAAPGQPAVAPAPETPAGIPAESAMGIPAVPPSSPDLAPLTATPVRATRPEATITFATEIARLRDVLDE